MTSTGDLLLCATNPQADRIGWSATEAELTVEWDRDPGLSLLSPAPTLGKCWLPEARGGRHLLIV